MPLWSYRNGTREILKEAEQTNQRKKKMGTTNYNKLTNRRHASAVFVLDEQTHSFVLISVDGVHFQGKCTFMYIDN